MRRTPTTILAISALAVAINVIAGSAVTTLKIPLLFLDAAGTIFVAVLFGPWWAFGTGIVTNLVMGVTAGPTAIPFGLVNGVIGLTVGLIARRYGFNLKVAVLTGLILSVVAPLVGTPIAVAVYGGLTGGAMDIFTMWLSGIGSRLFPAVFYPRVVGNLLDKILCSVLVAIIVQQLPKSLRLGAGEKRHAA